MCHPCFGNPGLGRRNRFDQRRSFASGQPFAAAEQTLVSFMLSAQTMPRNGFEVLEFERAQALLLAVARDRARQRMRREPFERVSQFGHFPLTPRRDALNCFHT